MRRPAPAQHSHRGRRRQDQLSSDGPGLATCSACACSASTSRVVRARYALGGDSHRSPHAPTSLRSLLQPRREAPAAVAPTPSMPGAARRGCPPVPDGGDGPLSLSAASSACSSAVLRICASAFAVLAPTTSGPRPARSRRAGEAPGALAEARVRRESDKLAARLRRSAASEEASQRI